MTTKQVTFAKTNWMSLANMILLISLIIRISMWAQATSDDIELLKNHTIDTTLHMPFSQKIQVFVPRIELDSRMENISKQLDRIEKKLDKQQ